MSRRSRRSPVTPHFLSTVPTDSLLCFAVGKGKMLCIFVSFCLNCLLAIFSKELRETRVLLRLGVVRVGGEVTVMLVITVTLQAVGRAREVQRTLQPCKGRLIPWTYGRASSGPPPPHRTNQSNPFGLQEGAPFIEMVPSNPIQPPPHELAYGSEHLWLPIPDKSRQKQFEHSKNEFLVFLYLWGTPVWCTNPIYV